VLHVVENFYVTTFGAESYAALVPKMQHELETSARQLLDQALGGSRVSGPPTKPAVMASGSPACAIVDYASEHGIDLIVICKRGRGGLTHLMLGTVAEKVVRVAPCPVLTIRHPDDTFVGPEALAVAACA
jgi:nucleotide-binding universal stress UspA family protein